MKQCFYIIEHMEPRLWKWSLLEYKHISQLIGKNNLWFTNIKDPEKLNRYGKVFKKSITTTTLKNACILDPSAKKTLTPAEAKRFRYFIFGGILGDSPAKKRTGKLTDALKTDARNLGRKQMATDNAVYAVKKIREGVPFSRIKFRDNAEIKIGKHHSVILPFRYVMVDGKPLLSEELIAFLKRMRGF